MDSSKLPLEARVAEAHDAAGRMMRTTKIVAGAKVYHHPLSFTVSEEAQKIFDAIRNYAEVNMAQLMKSDDRPLVFWPPRSKETVFEQDLVQNFDLVKEYLYSVGHETPLPHYSHHEAAFILCSVTFNLHSGVYGVRGGRGLIRNWARTQATRLRCLGTHLVDITRATPNSREPKIRVLKKLVISLHAQHGNVLTKRKRSSSSLGSEAASTPSATASVSGGSDSVEDMEKDLEEATSVEKMLMSPRMDVEKISVRRVLDFRDDLDDAVKAAKSSVAMSRSPPASKEAAGATAAGGNKEVVPGRSPLVKQPSDLPAFLKPESLTEGDTPSVDDGSLASQQAVLRKKLEEEKKDAALAKHEQKQNKKAELAEKKPKAKAKAKSKGKAEPKAEPKARGRPKKTVSPKKASPKKAPARKRKAVSPVPDGKKKNKMSDATPEPKSWKPSPMAKTGKQISSKNDERMSKAMEALEELKEKNADMPHFNIPDAGFSRKSYTVVKDQATATIGVVLYARSFYVNKAEKWPNAAVLRGLKANKLGGCTISWGDSVYDSWCIAMQIAGWSAE